MSGQIYLLYRHADGCPRNQRTLQRQFVQEGYERQTHAVVYFSWGVGVEEFLAIGKVDIAVGF